MVNESVILADLATRSLAELLEIRDDARGVVYGHATTISGLSQSVSWDKDSAGVVLGLVLAVIAGQGEGGATDPLSLRGQLGPPVRFGGRVRCAP